MWDDWSPLYALPQVGWVNEDNLDVAIGRKRASFRDETQRNENVVKSIDVGILVICLKPRVEIEYGILYEYDKSRKKNSAEVILMIEFRQKIKYLPKIAIFMQINSRLWIITIIILSANKYRKKMH